MTRFPFDLCVSLCKNVGKIIAEASSNTEEVIISRLPLGAHHGARAEWGMFRDRRPELYLPLLTMDGSRC